MFRTKEGPQPMLMGPSYKCPESMIKANKNLKNVWLLE